MDIIKEFTIDEIANDDFDFKDTLFDRHDVYIAYKKSICDYALSTKIYFKLVTINQNPDFDW